MDSPSKQHDLPGSGAAGEPRTLAEMATEGTEADLDVEQTAEGAVAPRRRITTLGDFELGPKIGSGAMGTVYRAFQVRRNRPAAVKVLKPHLAEDALFLARFLREAETLARLRHPNIVRCYSLGKQQGRYYIAMELVEGHTLGEWLTRLGRLSIADALCVTLAVTRALQHIHQSGIIHRDIKPNNILITPQGKIKLGDMGLARSVIEEDIETTQEGHGAGTPIYVAPEQARDARDADPRSDLYSLGCMLYQMLIGEPPFTGDKPLDIILAKINGRYAPARERMAELPLELDEILCRLLAAHPDERFQSATDLLRDLERWDVPGALSFLGSSSEPSTLADDVPLGYDPELAALTGEKEHLPPEKRWFVQSQSASGEWQTQRLTTTQILLLIQEEQFCRTASASLFRGSFRPLKEIVEFRDALLQLHHEAAPAQLTVAPPPPSQGHRTGKVLTLVLLALAIGFLLGWLLSQ